mmetsp:Transcript_15132/g.37193  ORF Transcript_15132/g.37193 Transcript_15132/m.37193 type:complete len:227 (+) Transcript_15132:670-1350(+)
MHELPACPPGRPRRPRARRCRCRCRCRPLCRLCLRHRLRLCPLSQRPLQIAHLLHGLCQACLALRPGSPLARHLLLHALHHLLRNLQLQTQFALFLARSPRWRIAPAPRVFSPLLQVFDLLLQTCALSLCRVRLVLILLARLLQPVEPVLVADTPIVQARVGLLAALVAHLFGSASFFCARWGETDRTARANSTSRGGSRTAATDSSAFRSTRALCVFLSSSRSQG